MTSRSINRQEFLVLTLTVGTAAILGCSDDPAAPANPGTGGSGGSAPGSTGGGGATATGGGGATATGGGGAATGGGGAATGGGGAATGGGGASTGGGGSGGAATGGGGASTGGGGSGGAATGGGGAGGGGAGGMCGTADITHTSNNQHTHIEMKAMVVMDLKAHINGAMATMPFTLPSAGGGGGHIHTITLTGAQITTLKGGGMVTGVMSSNDSNHTHTYTLACVA